MEKTSKIIKNLRERRELDKELGKDSNKKYFIELYGRWDSESYSEEYKYFDKVGSIENLLTRQL